MVDKPQMENPKMEVFVYFGISTCMLGYLAYNYFTAIK